MGDLQSVWKADGTDDFVIHEWNVVLTRYSQKDAQKI